MWVRMMNKHKLKKPRKHISKNNKQSNKNAAFTIKSCEGCLESIPTITDVKKCPEDISEWIKSKRRKQCHLVTQNCTTLEGFEYHCLPDKFHERFMEVCAPRKNIVGESTCLCLVHKRPFKYSYYLY